MWFVPFTCSVKKNIKMYRLCENPSKINSLSYLMTLQAVQSFFFFSASLLLATKDKNPRRKFKK